MIAGAIRTWIARGDAVGDDDRHPVRPGDILILVRQRGPLFEAIIRALKDANIPVAGADRLVLTEHIAVMDLLVLADALLLRAGRSGACDGAQEPAVRLHRGGVVCSRLAARDRCAPRCASEEPDVARALDEMADSARRETPFGVLRSAARRRRWPPTASSPGSGPRRTTRSTNSSISRSTTRAAKRHRCRVSWPGCATASADIKRDMEMARDEVRVMTVHGAKGLEAPIVILADTTTPPAGPPQYQPKLLALAIARTPLPGPPIVSSGCRTATTKSRRSRSARAQCVGRGRERISPAPLCGDDARGRPAGGVRRGRQAGNAARLLVPAGSAGARSERIARRRAGRSRRRHRAAVSHGTALPTTMAADRYARADGVRLGAGLAVARRCRRSRRPRRRSHRPARRRGATAERRVTNRRDGRSALLRGSLVHRLLQSLPEHPGRAARRAWRSDF